MIKPWRLILHRLCSSARIFPVMKVAFDNLIHCMIFFNFYQRCFLNFFKIWMISDTTYANDILIIKLFLHWFGPHWCKFPDSVLLFWQRIILWKCINVTGMHAASVIRQELTFTLEPAFFLWTILSNYKSAQWHSPKQYNHKVVVIGPFCRNINFFLYFCPIHLTAYGMSHG